MEEPLPEDNYSDDQTEIAKLCATVLPKCWHKLNCESVYLKEFGQALTHAEWLTVADDGRRQSLSEAVANLKEMKKPGAIRASSHEQMYIKGALLRLGFVAQNARYDPGIARGELRLQASGVAEPTSDSDLTSIRTTTAQDGDARFIEKARNDDIERKFHETRPSQIAPISTDLILSQSVAYVPGLPRSY